MPIWIDHLFAALMLVVFPAYSATIGRGVLAEMEQDDANRARQFRTTMIVQWVHTFAILGVWLWLGRDWTTLGLGFEAGLWFWVALALVLAMVVQQALQVRRGRRDPQLRARLRPQVEHVEVMLPRDRRERRWMDVLAVTAGVCEELAYRGFVLWYLSTWMPVWVAVIVGSLPFGLLHLYEGRAAATNIVVVALLAFGLYLLSGSLWLPMFAHAAFDMLQIRTAMAILGKGPGAGVGEADGVEGAASTADSAAPLQLLAQPDA